ncbi:unnamed protein product [Protopolystoma xenopodis]|uniref:VWFD domain-containing protein n=1 Tax=Protopolystoma xenopodis TaxID=117903 RepID=A0A3S5CM26_9PLAT|nr:unnamed protein product [Protopolystoma xenopodis]
MAKIYLRFKYRGLVTGLCGDFDGDVTNDNIVDFAESMRVGGVMCPDAAVTSELAAKDGGALCDLVSALLMLEQRSTNLY